MHNYKLTLSYDGTKFNGWQMQENALGIQPIIQEKLRIYFKEEVKLIGSGRTDAGVHALGQVAHFKCENPADTHKIIRSLNGMLPPEIRVHHCEHVPLEFHAQYSAKGKIYHYHLYLDEVMNPFVRQYRWHVRGRLDLEKLKEAGKKFLGTHDFTSFANEADEGSAAKDPVRTIYRLDLIPEEGGLRLEFEGDGFLYKMVRNIVGTLIEVARGKRTVESIEALFTAKDRRLAGMAAPPQGLFLVQVHY